MLTQGKHAKVRMHKEQVRLFKTYEDSSYVDNEFFALTFLAEQGIMNLNPVRESLYTLSMDFIQEAVSPNPDLYEHLSYLALNLALYLKNLHNNSMKSYGLYITHEDIFPDNLLMCFHSDILYFIDWGLSKKRDSVYPDIASALLGVFNSHPEFYRLFLEKYFGDIEKVDYRQINKYLNELYEEYKEIREKNNIETDSLLMGYNKAKETIGSLKEKGNVQKI